MLRTLVFTSLAGKDTNILLSSTKDSARQDITTDGRSSNPWVTVPCSDRDCWWSVK